jgi:hypothetical protein
MLIQNVRSFREHKLVTEARINGITVYGSVGLNAGKEIATVFGQYDPTSDPLQSFTPEQLAEYCSLELSAKNRLAVWETALKAVEEKINRPFSPILTYLRRERVKLIRKNEDE